MATSTVRETLEHRWKDIHQKELPTLARQKHSSQDKWPVQLDHCFARIILDAVIGRCEFDVVEKLDTTPAPWTAKLRSPAIRHMKDSDLTKCIKLGEAIAAGQVDLVQLDERSLKYRGKTSKVDSSSRKRQLDGTSDHKSTPSKIAKHSRPQSDIRTAFGARAASPVPPAPVDAELSRLIKGSKITDFRKRVLLALCQVPRGSVSSYLAMSNFLESSPRAVGNALRNNPFAPRVPCHRIVAADHSIGGFGGSWGRQGLHFHEKADLLRLEGVKVGEEGRVKGEIWSGFR